MGVLFSRVSLHLLLWWNMRVSFALIFCVHHASAFCCYFFFLLLLYITIVVENEETVVSKGGGEKEEIMGTFRLSCLILVLLFIRLLSSSLYHPKTEKVMWEEYRKRKA